MPKLSELTEITSVTSDDEVVITNDPGGTPATRRATITNLRPSFGYVPLADNVSSLDLPTDLGGFNTAGRAAMGDRGGAHYKRQTVTEVANVASLPGTGVTGTVYYAQTEGTYHRWLTDHYLIDRSMNGAVISNDGAHWRLMGREWDGLVFHPEMFGAVSDSADSSTAIQDALDRVISVNRLDSTEVVGQLVLSAGYRIDEPIRGFEWDETNAEFISGKTSYRISGISRGYTANREPGLLCNFVDGPGLVIAAVRSVTVENISIIGTTQTLGLPSTDELLNDDGATPWWDPAGTFRDERYTPFCGICIDPFATSTPPEGAYPDLTIYYGAAANNETSRLVTIDRCRISNFIVGVCISPTETEQLGDSIVVRDCNIDSNKVAISIGQDQNRGVYVENIHAIGCQVLVDGRRYGDVSGVPAQITGGVISHCKYLFNQSVNRGTMNVAHLYTELTLSMGYLTGGMTATFTGCLIKLERLSQSLVGSVDHHLAVEDALVTFIGGHFGYYADADEALYIYNPTGQVTFIGTSLETPPVFHTPETTLLDNIRWYYSSTSQSPGARMTFLTDDISTLGTSNRNYIVPPGGRIIDTLNSDIYENLEGYQYDEIETVTITVNAAQTGTFTAADAGAYRVGDILVSDSPSNTIELVSDETDSGVTKYLLGWVFDISGSTVTLRGMPNSLSTASYQPAHYRVGAFRRPTTGDTTNASNTITNVTEPGSWADGTWIKGAGIPDGTRVTNVAGSTLTISRNATATATGVDLYDLNPTVTAF